MEDILVRASETQKNKTYADELKERIEGYFREACKGVIGEAVTPETMERIRAAATATLDSFLEGYGEPGEGIFRFRVPGENRLAWFKLEMRQHPNIPDRVTGFFVEVENQRKGTIDRAAEASEPDPERGIFLVRNLGAGELFYDFTPGHNGPEGYEPAEWGLVKEDGEDSGIELEPGDEWTDAEELEDFLAGKRDNITIHCLPNVRAPDLPDIESKGEVLGTIETENGPDEIAALEELKAILRERVCDFIDANCQTQEEAFCAIMDDLVPRPGFRSVGGGHFFEGRKIMNIGYEPDADHSYLYTLSIAPKKGNEFTIGLTVLMCESENERKGK